MGTFDAASLDSTAPRHVRKTITFVGVVILHGIAFVAVSRIPTPRTKEPVEFAGTVFFVEARKRKEERLAPKPKPTDRVRRIAQPTTPAAMQVELDRSLAITSPSVDWSEERARVAEMHVNREAADAKQRPLLSKPKAMELPKKQEFKEHKRGDTERFDDGELRTWINDRCYVTNLEPVTPRLDPKAINIQCRITGRPPIVDGFDHVKPKYLRKEGEAPAKPKSLFSGKTITCDYSSIVCDAERVKQPEEAAP